MVSPLPDEIARLKALRDLAILDTAAEEAYDELTRSAALVCQVPIALISLVDEHRQWFKSRVGLDVSETARELAFCDHAIRQPHQLMEVADASADARFAHNALVTGAPGIRFYAGMPLVDGGGFALGTLCVIDRQPRQLEPWQREVLANLGHQVVRLFAARSAMARIRVGMEQRSDQETFSRPLPQVPIGIVQVSADGRLQFDAATQALIGWSPAQVPDLDAWFTRLCGAQAAQVRAEYAHERLAVSPQVRLVWLTCADGQRRQVEFHCVRTAQGEMWLLRDVTETAGAEERFRVLFEQSSDAHLLFDEQGIIDCNRAAIDLLRCSDRREVLNLHPARLSPEFQPDGRRSDEKCIEMDRLARERGGHRFEWLHRRSDGSDFLAEVMLTPVQVSGHPVLLAVWHDLTARLQAEEAQRQRDHRWLLALEASGDGVWDWNLDSDHVYFSPQWKAMLGHSEDEIGDLLSEWEGRLHPEDREQVLVEVKRHLAGETRHYVTEHRLRCKDGSWKWVLDRGLIIERHADGRPKRMIGTHSDLTERRRMEEALRLDEARFRAISDVSPMGIYVTDDEGRAIYLNERWCALAGVAAVEALDEGWSNSLHPEDRLRIREAWTRATTSGGRFSEQYRYQHADGRVVWVQGDAVPMQLAGRVSGYVGVVSDITEQHGLEIRLRDSIKRFDLVVAGAGMGIWESTFDPERWQQQIGPDLPCYWSPRLIEIMGYTQAQFPPRLEPWLDALHPDDAPRVLSAMRTYLADGAPYRVECRMRHRSGDYRWYHITGEVQRDEHGRPVRFAGSMSDITLRKRDEALLERARDEAQAATRAKSDFLATMSHELRTPMNGVIGMTTLLLDTPLNQQQRYLTETARTCGDQLLAVINDILDFSKIESGSMALEHIPFSPRRLSEDAVALFADQAEKKGLQIVCLIGADVTARLLGDPTRLRQVVLNLLGNAVKFTDVGEVVLSITTVGQPGQASGIELVVRDTGIGIPVEAREWLFKPFSQADSSTTRKYGGTGLGLVICQRLVQLMGGKITFESVSGRGTTFTARIPMCVAPDAAREPSHEGLVGRHVLVVGSSPAARRALREQVIGWGMTSAEVGDVADVPLVAAIKRPAVVIIDHDLPGGGLAIGRRLAVEPATAGVPLVLLVSGAHRGMATSAKEAGIVGFLTKPVRHAQLFECLLVVLNHATQLQARGEIAQPLLVTRHSLEEEREPRRVLVVEDNAINRQVAVMMLNKLGCRCDVASNGQEAVDAVGRQDYEAVFMDCQMPVMDGFAATQEIRRREDGRRHTRIIALTANAMQGDRERCIAVGMDDYLSKPLQIPDLEAVLSRADQLRTIAASQRVVPVPAQGPILDDAVLQALVAATDLATLKAVAQMTRSDAAHALEELRAAIRIGDLVSLGRTAHRLKGSSGTLGLRRVQDCCQKLENAARERQITEAGALVESIARALAEALPALAAHRLVVGN